MDLFLLLALFLSCRMEVGAQLQLSPETLKVIRGDEARFTCRATSSQWTVMVWSLNGQAELTISRDRGVLPNLNPNVTAEKNSASGDSWVLVLRSTQRHHQGQVTCGLQGIATKSASLFVQEMGSVKVAGENKLAFKGQRVVFECAAAGWHPLPRLQWQVNGRKVSEGEYNISSEESGKSLFTVTSNLSVTAAVSSNVDCLASVSALTTPLNSSVRLTVVAEVVQEVDDCTVPLAVTASLSAVLLLALLCVCTVLCYRERRRAKKPQENPFQDGGEGPWSSSATDLHSFKASPQEAIRFHQSVFGSHLVAAETGGKVNLGYSNEGPTDAAYIEQNTDTCSQTDFVDFRQVPDVVSSSSLSLHDEGRAQLCLTEESSMNVRRITTV